METLVQHLNINSKHFLVIIEHLRSAGGKARLVGGVVRDVLAGITNSDVDIATDLLPEQVINVLAQHNIKVIPTGIKFGTVTAIIKGESFEITTLREDFDCNGRHASVKYSNDFAQDAARRDFTINALSYCPITNTIYDYFGGIADLKAGRVVFIGDAKARITEDYLRILRFFRFSCRFAKTIDQESLAACIEAKGFLAQLSRERIKSEMDSLLKLQKNPSIMSIMFEHGILQEIFTIKQYDEQLHLRALKMADDFDYPLNLIVTYSLLFLQENDITVDKLLQWKFSRVEAKTIMKLLALKQFDLKLLSTKLKDIWLEELEYAQYFIFAAVINANHHFIRELYSQLKTKKIPIMPVNGNDLLVLGHSGKKLGDLMNLLKNKWIESDFTLDQAALINSVKDSEK